MNIIRLVALTVLFCFASSADSKELIKEFKGSANTVTAEFNVRAPWIADWRSSGDYPGSMGLQVDLVSSPGGEYMGKIVSTKWIDNGVRLFNESGRYRLQVNANLVNWTVRIEQLNRLEAEAYKPKNKD